VRYKVNDSLFVKFSAEYMLGGNYKLEGFTESKWWHLRFISTKYQAPYLVNNYFGNHREWHNQFTSSRAQTFEGALKLNLGSFNFYPSISFATLNGFIYFDNDKLPVQADNDITMIIPGVDMNIRFLKHMHFNNQVKYTLKGGGAADVYRVPEIHANAKLYFEKNIFNKVMWAQIGLDMHWQSSFYAYDYDPVVQQFYLQDDFEIPSYLLADLFISFKVKRFRWAFKMNNVLQNLEAEGYFTTPYYTGQKRTFDFAVNWMFFD